MAKSEKNKQTAKSVQIKNKKAFRDYELIEKVEAGMILTGTEVKSLRAGQVDLDGSYVKIHGNDVLLTGAKIAAYENAGYTTHVPDSERKLLLHKSQILKLKQRLDQKGSTIIPLKIYFNSRGFAKIEIAVAKGKKKYDKRDKITDRTMRKEMKF